MSAALKHVLDEATDAYFVGNLNSIDRAARLPFWGRLFVRYLCLPLERYALKKWKWTPNPEGQAVCKSISSAEKMCEGKPRWFWLKVPVEKPLPEETVLYGHSFPASDAREMYEELNLSGQINELAKQAGELRKIL